LVPVFAETGILVLVNMQTLDVKTVKFAVEGMTGAGEERLYDQCEFLTC
jgi:DNA polymerase delta subunit 2